MSAKNPFKHKVPYTAPTAHFIQLSKITKNISFVDRRQIASVNLHNVAEPANPFLKLVLLFPDEIS